MCNQPAMQFCQPTYPSVGYAPNYNTCNPPPLQYNGYPEIIGEGHVTSVLSPDGSIQYLFIPTTQWWRQPSAPCNPNFGSSNTQWNNNNAWFIRSAYPPMQPSSFQGICSPSYHGNCGSPLPCTSNSCIELHKPNYQVKFHNDGCTSTSDIHYFYPTLRGSNWFRAQRSSASCQTETSTTNSSCQNQEPTQVFCHLCKCSDGNKPQVEDMNCSNSGSSTSNMSLDKCDEIKYQKYKIKNSCKKKNSKESKCKCECYSKDKTKEKPVRMSYNSNSSDDKIASTKCDDLNWKKKSKEIHICECYPKDKMKNQQVRMTYSSNSSADKIGLSKSNDYNRKKKVICKANKVKKVICKCNEQPQKIDKSCITCNEQSSNCNEEFGKETQTKIKVNTASMTDLNAVESKKSVTFYGETCFGTPSCSCYSCYSTSETESEKRYSNRKKPR